MFGLIASTVAATATGIIADAKERRELGLPPRPVIQYVPPEKKGEGVSPGYLAAAFLFGIALG